MKPAVVDAIRSLKQKMIKDDHYFMKIALNEAKKAAIKGEVPVGCVIVYQNEIIAKAHNLRIKDNSVFGHAEIIAIRKANKKLNSWLLENCDIYVTLEPCTMCAGAILLSRMKRLLYATPEPKFGAAGSIINVFNQAFNHRVEVLSGIYQDEASEILKNFFKELRNR